MTSNFGKQNGNGNGAGANGNGTGPKGNGSGPNGKGHRSDQLIILRNLDPMAVAVVAELRTDPADSTRLKSLGICSGRRVQMVSRGDPLILRVLGTRIGLSARLADGIYVELCDGMGTPTHGSPVHE